MPCSMAIMGIAFLHFQVSLDLQNHASFPCQEMHTLQISCCIEGMQQQSLLPARQHLDENMPDTVMLSAELGAATSPSW